MRTKKDLLERVLHHIGEDPSDLKKIEIEVLIDLREVQYKIYEALYEINKSIGNMKLY